MGDGAAAALAALLEEGAMPNLKELRLGRNQAATRRSNDGIAALASALQGGALPACTRILFDYNPASDAPVREALASPERAAALARGARPSRAIRTAATGRAILLCPLMPDYGRGRLDLSIHLLRTKESKVETLSPLLPPLQV